MLGVGQLGLRFLEEYIFLETLQPSFGDLWVSAFSPATR